MDRNAQIPLATIQRLPAYLRCLLQAQAQQMPLVNSNQIAEMCGGNAAQVRKDLSYIGELGTRGIGYDVGDLIGHISRVLGIVEGRRVAVVGYGRLGSALLGYSGLPERGFDIVAVFDNDAAKIGTSADGLIVLGTDRIGSELRDRGVEIAIIATPAEAAQEAANKVVAAGVKAILNLAPAVLNVAADVAVRQVSLSTDLQILSFYLAQVGKSDS